MTVSIGIDWSAAKHDVCVLNENGSVIATTVLPPSVGIDPDHHATLSLMRRLVVEEVVPVMRGAV